MATRARIQQVQVLAQNLPVLASTRTRQNGVFQKYARLTRIADNWQTILSRLAKLVNRECEYLRIREYLQKKNYLHAFNCLVIQAKILISQLQARLSSLLLYVDYQKVSKLQTKSRQFQPNYQPNNMHKNVINKY